MLLNLFLLMASVLPIKGNTTVAADTVYIQPKDLQTKVLIPGTHRWLVYFKMGIDSPRTMFSIWTREIEPMQYKEQKAISVKQTWEGKDGIDHTAYSINDATSFAPLYHELWWKQTGKSSFDYATGEMKMNENIILTTDTSKRNRNAKLAFDTARKQYHLNWHLDLEVFPQLPFRVNTTYMINFFDPGFSAPEWQAYTVTGSALMDGYDKQKVDCWLLEHTDARGGKEIFWISKKTRAVLKLEQQFGKRFRYKIKLPSSV